MVSACVVTDSSAQFTNLTSDLQKLTTIIPLPISINGKVINFNESIKPGKLPKFASIGKLNSVIDAPSQDSIYDLFLNLGKSHETIFGIFLSSQLNPLVNIAEEAAFNLRGSIDIQVIDSRTTSIGLGFLVQKVAEQIQNGNPSHEINKYLRLMIPKVYSILCIPGLSYLNNNHFLDLGQAIIGELLGIFPLYSIEEGKLSPFGKARNLRNIVDYFVEFVEEFEKITEITLLQTAPPNSLLSQMLREQIVAIDPKLVLSEITINLTLASLFGPKTSGVFVLDSIN